MAVAVGTLEPGDERLDHLPVSGRGEDLGEFFSEKENRDIEYL